MNRPFRTLLLPVIVLCSIHLTTPDAAAQTGIVERVLEHYSGLETLQARFRQTMTSAIFEDESETVTGALYLKGKAYRVTTGTRTIVTDGTTSWIHDPVENQVLIDNQLEDEFSFSVHQFLYAFDERFSVEGVSRSGDNWLVSLSPLDPLDYFQRVELTVREADALITRIEIDDANEVHLLIELSDIRENPALDPALFGFEIPEGADVVDLRAN